MEFWHELPRPALHGTHIVKIVYDGHIFRWANPGGIRRYFWELISHLPPDWNPIVLGSEAGCPFPRHPGLEITARTSIRPRRVTQALQMAWWRQRTLPSARLFHPTYY